MQVKIVENKKEKLKLLITDASHESLRLIEEEALKDADVEFASYKREHLLKNEYTFLVMTKRKIAKNVFNQAVKSAAMTVKALNTAPIPSIILKISRGLGLFFVPLNIICSKK